MRLGSSLGWGGLFFMGVYVVAASITVTTAKLYGPLEEVENADAIRCDAPEPSRT